MSVSISPGIQAEVLPYHFRVAKAEDYVEYVVDMSTEDSSAMEFMETLAGMDADDRDFVNPEWVIGYSIGGSPRKFMVYVRKGTPILLKMDIVVGRHG